MKSFLFGVGAEVLRMFIFSAWTSWVLLFMDFFLSFGLLGVWDRAYLRRYALLKVRRYGVKRYVFPFLFSSLSYAESLHSGLSS